MPLFFVVQRPVQCTQAAVHSKVAMEILQLCTLIQNKTDVVKAHATALH